MKLKSISIFCSVLFFAGSLIGADVNKIIKNVQKKYDKMDYLTATFKQIETFKLTGSQTEAVGKIFIADGEKYRFESEDQIIVTDGKSIWTYNAISKQLLIDNVREDSGALLPRDLLFKYPKKYFATLLSENKVDKNTVFVIRLDPKENVYGYIKSIKLWVTEKVWMVNKIETTDMNGNTSLFEITDQDNKTKISAQKFIFQADEDTEVVDMR